MKKMNQDELITIDTILSLILYMCIVLHCTHSGSLKSSPSITVSQTQIHSTLQYI